MSVFKIIFNVNKSHEKPKTNNRVSVPHTPSCCSKDSLQLYSTLFPPSEPLFGFGLFIKFTDNNKNIEEHKQHTNHTVLSCCCVNIHLWNLTVMKNKIHKRFNLIQQQQSLQAVLCCEFLIKSVFAVVVYFYIWENALICCLVET